jgi:hypothetical protein
MRIPSRHLHATLQRRRLPHSTVLTPSRHSGRRSRRLRQQGERPGLPGHTVVFCDGVCTEHHPLTTNEGDGQLWRG